MFQDGRCVIGSLPLRAQGQKDRDDCRIYNRVIMGCFVRAMAGSSLDRRQVAESKGTNGKGEWEIIRDNCSRKVMLLGEKTREVPKRAARLKEGVLELHDTGYICV